MKLRTLNDRWHKISPPLILTIDNGTSGLGALAIDALSMDVVASSQAFRYGIS